MGLQRPSPYQQFCAVAKWTFTVSVNGMGINKTYSKFWLFCGLFYGSRVYWRQTLFFDKVMIRPTWTTIIKHSYFFFSSRWLVKYVVWLILLKLKKKLLKLSFTQDRVRVSSFLDSTLSILLVRNMCLHLRLDLVMSFHSLRLIMVCTCRLQEILSFC